MFSGQVESESKKPARIRITGCSPSRSDSNKQQKLQDHQLSKQQLRLQQQRQQPY
jgi:hypothetical protein